MIRVSPGPLGRFVRWLTVDYRAICLFIGHRYVSTQEFSQQSRRICCDRCHQMFAMNDDSRLLVPWDADFHRMYEAHGKRVVYLKWEGKKPC